MRKSLRTIAFLFSALLAAALVGCTQPAASQPPSEAPSQTASAAETATPAGTWAFQSLVQDGETYTADDLSSLPPPTESVPDQDNFYQNLVNTTLTFRDDGTVTTSINGTDSEGTWSQDGDAVTFTESEDASPSEAALSADTLTVEYATFSVVFEKA